MQLWYAQSLHKDHPRMRGEHRTPYHSVRTIPAEAGSIFLRRPEWLP